MLSTRSKTGKDGKETVVVEDATPPTSPTAPRRAKSQQRSQSILHYCKKPTGIANTKGAKKQRALGSSPKNSVNRHQLKDETMLSSDESNSDLYSVDMLVQVEKTTTGSDRGVNSSGEESDDGSDTSDDDPDIEESVKHKVRDVRWQLDSEMKNADKPTAGGPKQSGKQTNKSNFI